MALIMQEVLISMVKEFSDTVPCTRPYVSIAAWPSTWLATAIICLVF